MDAGSQLDLEIWQSRHLRELTPEQARWFQKARDETQLSVVTLLQGRAPEEQRERLREKMNGRTVRQFIQLGHQLAIARLNRRLADEIRLWKMHDELLKQPERVPGGYQRVRDTMEKITRQMQALKEEIAANEAVIRALSDSSSRVVESGPKTEN